MAARRASQGEGNLKAAVVDREFGSSIRRLRPPSRRTTRSGARIIAGNPQELPNTETMLIILRSL